ncbi:MAG: GNAT family N-acetyltransferase [Candidatus Thorarchaeota archaeon]|nr:GNAT family N-acetyltransferase [Candidatus Thorarchaeota archaeon]
MQARRGKPEDIEDVIELNRYSYAIPSDEDERMEKCLKEIDVASEFFIAERGGESCAHVRMIPLEQNVRSRWKKMAAVSMVASAPETRRLGYVREIMLQSLRELKEEGYGVSMLYPFKDSFYASMGYVKMPPWYTLTCNPRNIVYSKVPRDYRIDRVDSKTGWKECEGIHNYIVSRTHGAAKRTRKRWDEHKIWFRGNLVVVYGPTSDPEGYMAYKLKGYGQFGDRDEVGTMNIEEMLWKNPEALKALLRFISLHEDQIIKVKMPIIPLSRNYYHWIQGINVPNVKARFITMARIVDVEEALNGIPVSNQGSVAIKVIDDQFEWNTQTFHITGQNGELSVEHTDDSDPDIVMSIGSLTALLYGSLSCKELFQLGMLKERAPDILDDWFPKIQPWLIEHF